MVLVEGTRSVGRGEEAGAGAITTAGGDHSRGTRGGMLTRREDCQGAPPGPKTWSTAGGALPATVAVRRCVRVEIRLEGDEESEAAGLPGVEGACAAEIINHDAISSL